MILISLEDVHGRQWVNPEQIVRLVDVPSNPTGHSTGDLTAVHFQDLAVLVVQGTATGTANAIAHSVDIAEEALERRQRQLRRGQDGGA